MPTVYRTLTTLVHVVTTCDKSNNASIFAVKTTWPSAFESLHAEIRTLVVQVASPQELEVA